MITLAFAQEDLRLSTFAMLASKSLRLAAGKSVKLG